MATVYIDSYTKEDIAILEVTLETLIVLHVHKFCANNDIDIKVVTRTNEINEPLFKIALSNVSYENVQLEKVPVIATYCSWPVVVNGNFVVAGLASVARQIIKSSRNEEAKALLGFREACLMGCNETSIWTKFCEIDLPACIKDIFNNPKPYFENDSIYLPIHLSRFERHMEQPVRIHNVYKLARLKNNDKLIKSSVPIEHLNLGHKYSEGPFLTLSDLLLYPCYKILFEIFDENLLTQDLPLSISWYYSVKNLLEVKTETDFKYTFNNDLNNYQNKHIKIVEEHVANQSLYTADPKRYKPQNRIYTKQSEIEEALALIGNTSVKISNDSTTFGNDIEFFWDKIPVDANPKGGALPKTRANRKCQQLENLAKAVLKITDNKSYTIVDFCSGSGHLGILIATLLPNCKIILVENKERSLKRAQERITKMNLNNIALVQSNLDYFIATFNIGMALHACGVATDLVIQACIQNKAHFVVCPCCYGGIHDCHHLTYPRSKVLQNSPLTYRNYLIISHSADQTHDQNNAKTLQGFACMDVIDTDRKLQAIECGYMVVLSKLSPPVCTLKNNLLVGMYK